MEAEKLKVIAEGMGYSAVVIEAFDIHSKPNHVKIQPANGVLRGFTLDYNPLTNNDQMVEIMEKLKVSLLQNDDDFITAYLEIDEIYFSARGKTINEAVCNAAYEYFKNE